MKGIISFLTVLVTVQAFAEVPHTFGAGQGSGAEKALTVRGEVVSSSPMLGSWSIELTGNTSGNPDRTFLNPDGSFEVHVPAAGIYEVSVVDGTGRVVHRESAFMGQPGQSVSIRVPDSTGSASRAAGNTVSLHQLEHKVPAEAQKAFEKAHNAARKGNGEEAMAFFRQAVALDPEYADAHNDLGAAEAARGQFPEAAKEFQKAVDLEPEHPLALSNLSIVMAKMKNLDEAGRVARRALEIHPQDAQMHLILGSSLLDEKSDLTEALSHLKRAAEQFPKAHLLAAEALSRTGHREEAAEHVQEYLRRCAPDDPQRSTIEAWLEQLKQPAP